MKVVEVWFNVYRLRGSPRIYTFLQGKDYEDCQTKRTPRNDDLVFVGTRHVTVKAPE